MKRIIKTIDVIVILHNFLIDHNLTEDESYFYTPPPSPRDSAIASNTDVDDELNRAIHVDAPSGTRREQLRAYLSEKGIL